MRVRLCSFFAILGTVALFGSSAWAQSSGNFNYNLANGATTGCTVNSSTGAITGGVTCGPISSGGSACTTSGDCATGQTCSGQVSCTLAIDPACVALGETCDVPDGFCTDSGICSGTASKTCVGSTDVAIKTSSGKGNVFDVRPSAVIALLTDVTVNSKQKSTGGVVASSAFGGVDFQITLSSQPSGSTAKVIPSYPVTYDARFIQISTNLFQAIASECQAIAGGCFISFDESTASAHSFDWIVAPLTSGDYDVHATWTSSLLVNGIAESETCVGPVNLTVAQDKIFAPTQEASSDVTF